MSADPVVRFYSGGVDHRGRTADAILAWSDDRLESVHDYIQWLFPTSAPSGVNPFAPLITTDTIAAFQNASELRERMRESLDRMLRFYGLQRGQHAPNGGRLIAIDPTRFCARAEVWLHPGNHNHLRLTRIMLSLKTLGLEEEAKGLQRCLLEVGDSPEGRRKISATTRDFWTAALGRARLIF